jgi:hypothetical protein
LGRLCVVAPVFVGEPAMNELQSAKLIEAVRGLADKVERFREQYRGRNLGEENTKAAVITPLLAALDWNTGDPD